MSTLSARRPLSVIAVLAMVATMLFAINATTASAAAPASPAVFTACPNNAGISDGGFSDVSVGSLYNDSVNCLKYYKVTQGTTASTYGPDQDMTRSQMALFLARLAFSAGVSLSPMPPNAGFTDTAGLSPEAQKAINQLAHAGIVKGKTATTYDPDGPVLRNQMALFLTRFLDAAHIGPGGTALGSAATTGAPFTDVASQTAESQMAIQQVWNLGVTTGNTATTYNPAGHVTRGQMALFMTRTAAHANTRPAGVNMQIVPNEGFGAFGMKISVTVRNTDFSPSANTDVNLFSTLVTDPFNTDGTCDTLTPDVYAFGGAVTPCTVSVADPTVDIFGNLPVFPDAAGNGSTATAYAWTGAVAEEFNINTTAHSKVAVTSHADWGDASAAPGYKVVEAGGVTSNTVMTTVYDWFGYPVPAGVDVHFESDQPAFGLGYLGGGPGPGIAGPPPGPGFGQTNQTNGSGVAHSVYHWNSLTTAEENFVVWTAATPPGDETTFSFYWVNEGADGDTTGLVALLVVDSPAKTFVIWDAGNTEYETRTWKAGDTFRIGGVPKTQAQFETAIDAATMGVSSVTVVAYGTASPSEFNLVP